MSKTEIATTEQKTTVSRVDKRFIDAYMGKLGSLDGTQTAAFLIALGERLGVRAELGELILYQGKPYITLEGRIRLAHKTGLLSGIEARPASELERKRYGAEAGEALWVAVAYRHGASRGFLGWGFVNPKTDRNPVAKQYPREMAKKRAKYDALRLAFPPAEAITELHGKYIEEAEIEAEKLAAPEARMLTGGYEQGAEESAPETETATAEPTATDDTPDGELPLGR